MVVITNTPRAGEGPEQTAARSAPRNVAENCLITFTKINSPQGDHEASISLKWYAAIGNYNIKIYGVGTSKEEAAKSAMLMLGQAKAALTVATVGREMVHRASEQASAPIGQDTAENAS